MELSCRHCDQNKSKPESRTDIVRFGFFARKSDGKSLQRYRCQSCRKTFSVASSSPCLHQNKRQINGQAFEYFVSGVSQRRSARLLRVNRKTVVRKLVFMAKFANEFIKECNRNLPKATSVEFDDLETMEHSKCKPLAVSMMVETKTRRILGYRVARMPAKGLLAAIARKKYGYRKDERPQARASLFRELQEFIEVGATIKSDMHPSYVRDVQKYFPKSEHKVFKGRKGCVVGQGELKSGGFDPIFSLNHTFAMLRANINRLFRRTWNTTKDPAKLAAHIALYVLYHNLILIQNPSR